MFSFGNKKIIFWIDLNIPSDLGLYSIGKNGEKNLEIYSFLLMF